MATIYKMGGTEESPMNDEKNYFDEFYEINANLKDLCLKYKLSDNAFHGEWIDGVYELVIILSSDSLPPGYQLFSEGRQIPFSGLLIDKE